MSNSIQESSRIKPVSLRAGIIGLMLAAIVSLWGQFSADHMGYNYMSYAQMPSALLLPFFVLIMGPHLILRKLAPDIALNPTELVVIFVMGLIASMVPDWGMTRYLTAIITGPYYHASPENRWEVTFFDTLPDWLVITGAGDVVRLYFEGAPPGYNIPWLAWLSPLFWWMSCFAALLWTGACIVVILRKQWVEHERLRFPMGEVAMNLMRIEKGEADETPMVRTPMFRMGLFLSLFATVWNIVSYWDIVSPIPIMGPDYVRVEIYPGIPEIAMGLNVFALCFAFFINTEILFSVWFFLIFTTVQRGVMNMFGVTASTSMVPTGLVGTQSIGALIALVVWGLWMARSHLAEVVRKASGKSSALNDHDELFSYRTAVIGFVVGILYLFAWLYSIGMSLPICLVFLTALFIIYLGMARMVAEAGLVTLDLPVNPNLFTAGIIGADNLNSSTITALGMTNAFARNWRTFTMIGLSHAAWFRRWMGASSKHLFLWISLSFLMSVCVSFYYYITAGYSQGADNLLSKPGDLVPFFYGIIMQLNSSVRSVSGLEMTFFLSGVGMYMLMIVGRYLFVWWPLHPIGLVAVAADTMRYMFLPFFLAWLLQVILLRLGGGRIVSEGAAVVPWPAGGLCSGDGLVLSGRQHLVSGSAA